MSKLIGSSNFKAVLDTNVLYPAVVRDYLLWLATAEMYSPRWSEDLLTELTSVFERNNGSTTPVEMIKEAFQFALVENYEKLTDTIELPDPKDRHVVAAAIKCNANRIITNNLKDFPNEYLEQFGLVAIHPDGFIADLIDLNPKACIEAYRQMVVIKENPPYSELEYLEVLRNNELIETADELSKYL